MVLIRKTVLRAFVRKEFMHLLRDRRVRGVLFGSPVLMLLLFGYAVNTDVRNVRIAVFDEDKSSMSRAFVERFTSSGYFARGADLSSEKELLPLIDSGTVDMYIHMERGFKKKVTTGMEADVQIVIDGMDSTRASVIIAYINEITLNFSREIYNDRIRINMIQRSIQAPQADGDDDTGDHMKGARLRKGIGVKERFFFNPDLSSRNFFLPGVIGLVVALVIIMLTSMSIVKERETGTIEQIIVSPLRPHEYILGKTVPFAIIGLFDIMLISAIAIFWFKVPFNGNFIFLMATGSLYTLSSLAQGLYISTISRTQQQAMVSTFLMMLPSIMLSGFVFPVDSMPPAVQAVTYINPLRYFIAILRGIFLKGVGFTDLWREVIPLIFISTTILYLSARRFARRLE